MAQLRIERPASLPTVELGLRENAAQFALLVAITGFVGAMVGLERSTLPLVGREDFGLSSSVAVLSFIVAFGFSDDEINAMTRTAIEAAFVDEATRKTLLAKI